VQFLYEGIYYSRHSTASGASLPSHPHLADIRRKYFWACLVAKMREGGLQVHPSIQQGEICLPSGCESTSVNVGASVLAAISPQSGRLKIDQPSLCIRARYEDEESRRDSHVRIVSREICKLFLTGLHLLACAPEISRHEAMQPDLAEASRCSPVPGDVRVHQVLSFQRPFRVIDEIHMSRLCQISSNDRRTVPNPGIHCSPG
jgi:hypothetical protein